METNNIEKGTRFFKYLLELNNLVGKVVRDYRDFETNWFVEDFSSLKGCNLLDECEDESNFMEIHKPLIKSEEKQPPALDSLIKGWIDGDIHNENSSPSPMVVRTIINEEQEEKDEYFEDEPKREEAFDLWKGQWDDWAKNLRQKRKVSKLYSDFFELVSRFEKEGESLEFIFGRGILTWRKTVKKVENIRHPLLTCKLELELDAEKGIIAAKQIEEGITVEREMLSGINLPNMEKVEGVLQQMKQKNIDDEDLSELFHHYVQLISPEGQYVDGEKRAEIKDTPIIYDQTLFSLRSKKVRVLRDDLENIIQSIESHDLELSESVISIFDGSKEQEVKADAETDYSFNLPRKHLYFPLPSNEQQKEIVRRIDNNYGVTVQGPPGTGKTHTIANLVSHFLAQGQRILITSQKENPLKVLKDKIPEDIRALCVAVLGGGRESMADIEKSIRILSEKLGELDAATLEKEIERNLLALDTNKRREAEFYSELKTYAKEEGTRLEYKGEQWFKYDVAKYLVEENVDYRWIKDDVAMDAEFPINKSHFFELWNARDKFEQEDLKLFNRKLPRLQDDIISSQSFEKLVKAGEELNDFEEKGTQIIEKYQLKKSNDFIDQLTDDVNDGISMKELLEKEPSALIIKEVHAGGGREKRWRDFVEAQKGNVDKAFEFYNQLVTHSIKLPDKPKHEIKVDLSVAKDRLVSGKKPNFFFYAWKGKRAKYLFEEPVLNGKPLMHEQDIEPVEAYLAYEELREEIARVINGNMNEIGHHTVDENSNRFPHEADRIVKEVSSVVETVDFIKKIQRQFTEDQLKQIDFYNIDSLKRFADELFVVKGYLDLDKWNVAYQEELTTLQKTSMKEDIHPIILEFIEAFEKKDTEHWNDLIEKLLELRGKQKEVKSFYDVLTTFKEKLPVTAVAIESSVGNEWGYPENYHHAFELRKLQTWLDETKDMNVAKIKDQLEEQHQEQEKLITEIVTASTWKAQLARISDTEKRALSSWKSYIKRYGKGSGKHAQVNLEGARESMKTAQGAIPVWVMPVNQVLENFPVTNEKFDVVIFDESSQCDLFSTNVLLRGKKIIVVGDEEQISPQAIGTKQDDVYDLVNRYLNDVPNAKLLDGNISLYELAEQTFPKEGKLMLREHFRCVPEIIQFSNDLSYGGEMIPLRLPLENQKIDPPVKAIKVNDGYNDDAEKDINRPEAEKIAADISEIVADPKFTEQTIGVIALQGTKQSALLEQLIREEIGDEQFVKRKIICGNAYTLQGDERDIICLSMVVAPNRRFRSLTRNSEKQRMNVAASRAKNQMRLYHSVDSEDLSVDDLRYRLIGYCKQPNRINEEIENLEELCDSPFEIDVLRMIVAKGYKVTPQVKVGRYRIDLVVEGIGDRLAIECDGERWHGPEKFDEDMQRQESLERSGWKFWRIRGREFYFNRTKAMESLWERLKKMGIQSEFEQPIMSDNYSNEFKPVDHTAATTEPFERANLVNGISEPFKDMEQEKERAASVAVQTKLFDMKDEKLTTQMDLFEDEIETKEKVAETPEVKEDSKDIHEDEEDFSLYDYLERKGFEVVDKRDKGGCIWIVGGKELAADLKYLESIGYIFIFTSKGSKAIDRRPGWYYKA
ncbi:AAA domain-containing protein [Salipaludibacillus daqingensis]|uniref:AAA domain-containing protein n=1 Tax=Salipaludibacillus daqingensis TaxID=3041001 RepID=UPI002473FF95|nr:AAA domain-containing protein [Salipaludibacillus daqingensis]